jgi:hypothetical protein
MQFLSVSRRRVDDFPPDAFTPELAAKETQRVPGAVILWEASSEADVRAALATLPIFQAGMLEIVLVVPLEPYPGFGPAQS